MSTELAILPSSFTEFGTRLISFYGGREKGRSIQITQDTYYIQLTRREAETLCDHIVSWLESSEGGRTQCKKKS